MKFAKKKGVDEKGEKRPPLQKASTDPVAEPKKIKTSQENDTSQVQEPISNPESKDTKKDQIESGDGEVKRLIDMITKSNEMTIKPVINFEKNIIEYPILAKIGRDPHDVDFLEKLATNSVNLLERQVFERVVVCPQHTEDLSVNVRLYCPHCSSSDVERLDLVEHKICGYIAEKKEFGVEDVEDIKACPNCKRQIKDFQKEIRQPGKWNICNSCNKKFDDVIIKLHCRRFDHDFDITKIESVVIPAFKINADAIENMGTLTLIPQIKKIIIPYGFEVEEMAAVKGKSGVAHQVSLYGYNNENKTIVVFIKTAKGGVPDSEVNAAVVNVLDISPTITIFVVIPSVSEMARVMASAHGINIITGTDINQIITEVRQVITNWLSVQTSAPKKIQ